jgi:hypothetical protein
MDKLEELAKKEDIVSRAMKKLPSSDKLSEIMYSWYNCLYIAKNENLYIPWIVDDVKEITKSSDVEVEKVIEDFAKEVIRERR